MNGSDGGADAGAASEAERADAIREIEAPDFGAHVVTYVVVNAAFGRSGR